MNFNTQKKSNGQRSIIAVVLIVVLLSSCALIGSLIAWLTDEDVITDPNEIVIGSVDFEIYNNGTKITTVKSTSDGTSPNEVSTTTSSAVAITGNSTIRDVGITIRNTGTVAAIMRVSLRVYYMSGTTKIACILKDDGFTLDNQIAIDNTNWVNRLAQNNQVASGYTYYNKVIQPYTISQLNSDGDRVTQNITANEVELMQEILVPESMKDTTYYIELTVEGVAHAGNIYQEEADTVKDIPVEAYPFGILTEDLLSEWIAWRRDQGVR